MTMPSPLPERLCPLCGEEWPRLTEHTCPHPVAEDPEALIALLWDVMTDVPVMIGDLSISTHVAACIVRPMGRALMMRVDELLAAIERGE